MGGDLQARTFVTHNHSIPFPFPDALSYRYDSAATSAFAAYSAALHCTAKLSTAKLSTAHHIRAEQSTAQHCTAHGADIAPFAADGHSPLILGFDMLDDATMDRVWPIITNTEAIAINQVPIAHHSTYPASLNTTNCSLPSVFDRSLLRLACCDAPTVAAASLYKRIATRHRHALTDSTCVSRV